MSNSPLKLDRKTLAEFLPNFEAIKAFENLFQTVAESLPDTLSGVELTAESAQQQAGEALASLAVIANHLSLILLAPVNNYEETPQIYTPPLSESALDCYSVQNKEEVAQQIHYGAPVDFSELLQSVLNNLYVPSVSSIDGNAATATKLQIARTINGTSFDGSANITINAVDSTARAKLAGDSTQDFSAKDLTVASQIIASGGQIKFPAVQAPSADPNTLDDYEEGTFTLTDNSGAGLVLVAGAGNYTKIGREVSWQATVTYPATASGANASIGGFPFNMALGGSAQGRAGVSINATDSATLNGALHGIDSATSIAFYATFARVTNATLSGKTIYMSGHYIV